MPREVIVADDDFQMANLITQTVLRFDPRAIVHRARNWGDAVDCYQRSPGGITVVVTDFCTNASYYLTDRIRGIEAQRDAEARKNGQNPGPRVPIILISSYASWSEARGHGCDVYLQKPVEVQKMGDALSGFLYM